MANQSHIIARWDPRIQGPLINKKIRLNTPLEESMLKSNFYMNYQCKVVANWKREIQLDENIMLQLQLAMSFHDVFCGWIYIILDDEITDENNKRISLHTNYKRLIQIESA